MQNEMYMPNAVRLFLDIIGRTFKIWAKSPVFGVVLMFFLHAELVLALSA